MVDALLTSGPAAGPAPVDDGDRSHRRIRSYLEHQRPATPCLVLDLDIIRQRYRDLRALMPHTRICYAVKACPQPQVVRALAALGSSFDVASPGEIDLCLREGAAPESISYGNTIKKGADIAYAHERGVRLFATDSHADVDALAENAPSASVFCRIQVDNTGSRTPFGAKFGCAPEMAVHVLRHAHDRGLDAAGVSFHIGSQQHDTGAWHNGTAEARAVFDALAEHGITPRLVNLGGGLPATYTESVPEVGEYASTMAQALTEHFGGREPQVVVEPGRFIAGDAGILRSEVVLVARKSAADACRWVYLDVGRYNGLAETEGEAITYRVVTPHDGGATGPVVLAGPSCDGDDVLYQRTVYELPLNLRAGDYVDLLSTGAYTASYSSVEFNGFGPLPTHCIGDPDVETDRDARQHP